MGRGRAKAKQTKVARELKYKSVSTDFSSLERELRGSGDDIPGQYADLAESYDSADDDLDDDESDEDDDDEEPSGYSMRRSG